jgi:hypothetical protein
VGRPFLRNHISIFGRAALALAASFLWNLGASRLFAAVYQWSIPIEGAPHELDPGYPRAFLWIPPNCTRVRAIILSQNNMEEESILEDASFRKTLSDLGFAEIWITRTLGSIHFRFDQGAGEMLDKVLSGLAATSGYEEIEFAPLVPIGHSAMASFGWDIAAWNPARTLAVLSISGQWPYFKDVNTGINGSPEWGERTMDGVPGLTTKGEYEIGGNTDGWYFHLRGDSLKQHPKTVFTQVVEPGGGHFNASAKKIALIALYLRKATQYRLPATAPLDGPVILTPIDPTRTGWLFDEWHLNRGPASPAAPVAEYQGDQDQAFWAFDEEMVRAIERFQAPLPGKANVLVGYKQNGALTPPTPDHAMVHLKFDPEEDGVTVRLAGGFWDNVPPTRGGNGSEWADWLGEGIPVKQGEPIAHPRGAESRIVISRICGPVIQTGSDTFVLHSYRVGTHDRKSNAVWLAATWPGDNTYRSMVQQAQLTFPLTNKAGTPQTISFPDIPSQSANATPVKLNASSSAGAPVSYYVREGPAEVSQDGLLTFTPIPPRAKYPVKVTLVACQWGRSINPMLRTADPVERTFSINRP